MGLKMSKSTREEPAASYRKAYAGAMRLRKTEILNAFVEAAGYHRTYASGLLSGQTRPKPPVLGSAGGATLAARRL